jgi:hypothetical protein
MSPGGSGRPSRPTMTGVMPEVRPTPARRTVCRGAGRVEAVQLASGFADLLSTGPSGIMPPTADGSTPPSVWHPPAGVRPDPGVTCAGWICRPDRSRSNGKNDRGAFYAKRLSYTGVTSQMVRLSAPRGTLDADLTLQLPGPAVNGRGGLVAPDLCPHVLRLRGPDRSPVGVLPGTTGKKDMYPYCRLIREGGVAERTGEGIRLSGADSLLILAKNGPN